MSEYRIEYLLNGTYAKATVLASTRAAAAKWMCRYERSRGNAYTLLKASRIN